MCIRKWGGTHPKISLLTHFKLSGYNKHYEMKSLSNCYGWMFVDPQNSYIEALILSVIVFEGRAFER